MDKARHAPHGDGAMRRRRVIARQALRRTLARPLGLALYLALTLALTVPAPASAQTPAAEIAEPVQADASARSPRRLELWTIDLARDFAAFVEESVDGFEAAHPDVEVVWRDLALGELPGRLADAHATGRAPDVVNVNVPLALAFAERGWLRDLGPSLDAGDHARWYPNLLASFRLGGRELAVPWYVTVPVLFYDPDAFARAGLDPHSPPGTSAEAFAAARQLHDRLDAPALWPSLSGQQLLYRFLEAGLPVTDDAGRRAAFDGEAHAALLGELVHLFETGVLPSDAFEENVGTPASAFVAGRIPMVTANPSLLVRLASENPDLYARVAIAPYPLGPGQAIHAPLMGLALTAASPHPEVALDLVRHLAGVERQLAFARIAAILPTALGAADDPWFAGDGSGSDDEQGLDARARQVAVAQLPYARDLTMELPNASQLFRRFERDVVRAFLGLHSPIEALRAAARFWNALL